MVKVEVKETPKLIGIGDYYDIESVTRIKLLGVTIYKRTYTREFYMAEEEEKPIGFRKILKP